MIRTALLWMFSIFAMVGCSTDYSIIGEVGKEYIYIEVPGEDRLKIFGLIRLYSPLQQMVLIYFGLLIDPAP